MYQWHGNIKNYVKDQNYTMLYTINAFPRCVPATQVEITFFHINLVNIQNYKYVYYAI